MKTALFFFIIGLAVGGYAMYRYDQSQGLNPSMAPAREKIDQKLIDWHLTNDDIKADLAKTGQVVRTKAAQAGGVMSDARIHTVIKAKYVLDRDLSATDIDVSVDHGSVILNGTVASETLVGEAVALAMDTDGVTTVSARLTIKP